MNRRRPARVSSLRGIGVDRMGALATQTIANNVSRKESPLRLENLDTDVPPDPIASELTSQSCGNQEDNSYLPFTGQLGLREAAAKHVSRMTNGTVKYDGEKNCVISTGGLHGCFNTLLATVEAGDGVLMTDPTYIGLINRVKLVGAVPVFVPLEFRAGEEWKLDHDKLRACVKNSKVKITAMLLLSPGLPTGAYFTQEDWRLISEICVEKDMLLIYDAAFERLLFDGREVIHPATFPDMAQRTITVGSASKELRMIGWRIGWIVGPEWLMSDISLVSMANVVVPAGVTQKAVQVALERSHDNRDVEAFAAELQRRRDVCMQEMKGLPIGIPAGGWAFVVRVDSMGWTGSEAAQALIKQGVFVTSMDGWGEEHASQYVRVVFSNESCERLTGIGGKFRAALGIAK